ncbi:MAG: UDP-2,4-diacetamido-2,4,6-trideoxy-beta-L-altropyranose hydrolase [Pseudomonadota bacterium]|nr:UDP-2,4-diacetamido-2,4,6-trideoxy-beta-L-altropyranose hydrolase [Pseudomonadota bacterium]
MIVTFRVDASLEIGSGHLVRCLTLADALLMRGAHCRFVCRQIPESLKAMIVGGGHELIPLDAALRHHEETDPQRHRWLSVSQTEDARQTIAALQGKQSDWLIVDHYALDAVWEAILRSSATRILAIDDLADRQHDCDALLDQNLYLDADTRYAGKLPNSCSLLLGPRFALLREEFSRARTQVKPRSGPVERILVFYGGVDATNCTGFAIEALSIAAIRGAFVDVVIGADHPKRKEIAAACKGVGFALHVQTQRMAELMSAADLGMGAGGSATWERCCVGLPTVATAVAKNQEALVRGCALSGGIYAIDLDGAGPHDLALHVSSVVANPLLRESISRKGMEIVDGGGTRRVMRSMGIFQVAVRQATNADSRNLFEWRNHPAVRQSSRSTAPLEWAVHSQWLGSVLADPTKELLIGEKSGRPVGVVRFDVAGEAAEVSIYTVFESTQPDERSSNTGIAGPEGAGAELLAAAERWLSRNRPAVRCINAEVLKENRPSHRLFNHAGYLRQSVMYTKRVW